MKTLLAALFILLFTNCQAQPAEHSLLKELKEKVVDKTYPKIDAIVVKRGDTMIIEDYFNGFKKDTPHDMRSSFKSITSLLAGIAIDKKLMALDDNLGRFFPELKDEGKRKISVRNLLEMRSGLGCEEFYDIGPECEEEMVKTQDWVAYCLGVDRIREPGLNWSYNSNEPMLVGEIIARASGMSVMDFAKENLFQPLGIKDYKWTVSPKGQGMTAGSFYMKPLDMLKIMDLVRNKGRWKGTQIVSADWIEASTNGQIVIDFSFTRYSKIPNAQYESARYGFFWYKEQLNYKDISTEVLFASGNGGQYMMLLPEYNVTAVFTGSNYGNWRGKLPFEMLLKYILPALEKENNR
ncbi:CubicO group peptidase (beta-lactamase class C family) [Rhabdobacter roseus]|uniref:CubicO group peptidase (Beta-lactamase class C family) n=1 Tax=Rhabdobacter roseus TaxID=1655419 RepID=A0A840TPC9_9BACT|nr:serine hydrolase [Rhabdobacter roseus]MBB5286166.1 CubicO group peptidase (beta-lactamase class C family) [Rhabdobacter roseus]